MTLRYEDFNLYYQHTYLYVDGRLSYIRGVRRAETPTNYLIEVSPLAQDGSLEEPATMPSRNFPAHMLPFVPEYGYVNHNGFAVFAMLGAYRMARRAFSLDRVDLSVPNNFEFLKFLRHAGLRTEDILTTSGLVKEMEKPSYTPFKAAVEGLFEGEWAGTALSKDFALVNYAREPHLGLFYKTTEVAHVSKKGELEFIESGKVFQEFFKEQVSA